MRGDQCQFGLLNMDKQIFEEERAQKSLFIIVHLW
jgi:hypothetical protein